MKIENFKGLHGPTHVTQFVLAAILLTSVPSAVQSVSAAAKNFKIDPVHSFVTFKVKHKHVGYVFGRFNEMSGTVKFDEAHPATSSLQFTIRTASIDTANDTRDKHLRGPDFFDVKQFPVMTFKSKSTQKTRDDTYAVTGDLSIKGVTKSITAPVEHVGTATSPRGTTTGALCTFKIKRSDYGITYGLGSLGDDVEITVALEANGK